MSTMTREISKYNDFIDSRDVIARIAELQADVDRLKELEAIDRDDITAEETSEWNDLRQIVEDDAEELRILEELAEEGVSSAEDWQYGATLINEAYFTEYARELAGDIHGGAIENAAWPFTRIDWEAAADDLEMDYTTVEFDGITFYVR